MPSPVRARRFAAPRGLPLPNRTLRVLREGGYLKRPALALSCVLNSFSRGRRFAPVRSYALGNACYADCQGSGSQPGGSEVRPEWARHLVGLEQPRMCLVRRSVGHRLVSLPAYCFSSRSSPTRIAARSAIERTGMLPSDVSNGASASSRAIVCSSRRALTWFLVTAGRLRFRGLGGTVGIGHVLWNGEFAAQGSAGVFSAKGSRLSTTVRDSVSRQNFYRNRRLNGNASPLPKATS